MIKITFEVSEDFIRESATPESTRAKLKANQNPFSILAGLMGFSSLNQLIEEQGKTEFIVSKDKLSEKSRCIYDSSIGDICILAVLSEIDSEEGKSAE